MFYIVNGSVRSLEPPMLLAVNGWVCSLDPSNVPYVNGWVYDPCIGGQKVTAVTSNILKVTSLK